jgi:hypothetical protein
MELALANKLANKIDAFAVVPVSLGISKIQENGTDIMLKYVNDRDLNLYTAFLTANMFYAAIFKESTGGFSFDTAVENKLKNGKDPDGGESAVVFKDPVKRLLQKIAFDAVVDFYGGNIQDL